jgi:hypothetical protein
MKYRKLRKSIKTKSKYNDNSTNRTEYAQQPVFLHDGEGV